MTQYEIERRANLWLEDRLPSEAKLERIYGGRDYYFAMDPYLRVRDMKLVFKRGLNLICPQSIQRVGMKKIIDDGEVEETETSVSSQEALKILNERLGKPKVTETLSSSQEALKILNERLGKPKVIVEGCRREYSLKDLRFCSDYITNLGFWTEIEKVTKSKEENSQALREVEGAFESMRVSKNQLEQDIYPLLLCKKFDIPI